MQSIRVIAVFTTKPGKRAEVLALLSAIVPTIQAEEGCIEYCLTVDVENASPTQTHLGPDTFAVVENWDSLTALKAHATSAHMAAFSRQSSELIIGKTVHILETM